MFFFMGKVHKPQLTVESWDMKQLPLRFLYIKIFFLQF